MGLSGDQVWSPQPAGTHAGTSVAGRCHLVDISETTQLWAWDSSQGGFLP